MRLRQLRIFLGLWLRLCNELVEPALASQFLYRYGAGAENFLYLIDIFILYHLLYSWLRPGLRLHALQFRDPEPGIMVFFCRFV